MRIAALVLAVSMSATALTFVAPEAQAFGWCTFAPIEGHECREYYACIGWGWDSRGEHCQYGVGPWYCAYDLDPCLPWIP